MTPSKSKTIRLGELQLRIMKILWKLEEATVSEVHDYRAYVERSM